MRYNLPVEYDNLSPKEKKLVREQYVKDQHGNCMYCGVSLNKKPPESITKKVLNMQAFPPGFLKYPVHLQHCHNTRLTEGAVHAYCNGVLWQYYGR